MTKINFNDIDWNKMQQIVSKFQEKIVVAWKKEEYEKVKRLQDLLVRNFAARALAVKKVINNDGGKTPGIDGIIWNTEEERTNAIISLKENILPKPLKRIYIPKANGKLRPLSIPCIYDRAKQALYLLALDPISEEKSDERSYGFRKYRSCQDAIEYLYVCLNTSSRARYILDADIKGFFDNISHEWLLKNIPMDKKILKEWLEAGHLDKSIYHNTELGVPQGGIISPTIANMTLNGLEKIIKENIKIYKTKKIVPKVNIVRYADDIIITANTIEIIEETIIPTLKTFLGERGLELNMEKTEGLCKVCGNIILPEEETEIHHILSRKKEGNDIIKNLLILHKTCHRNVTYNKDPKIQAKYIELGIIKDSAFNNLKKK